MLEQERYKCTFDTKEMGYSLHGSKEYFEKYTHLQKTIAQDPILRFKPELLQTSRKQMMLEHAKKLVRYHQLFDFDYVMKMCESSMFAEQMPLSLHFVMFLITLNNLCTDKQSKKFYEKAIRCEILGCYGQTQLGHGSDIQNLMTTATYDVEKQQFIIDTPSVDAAKWWIGDLGNYATHAIIFAQLIIHGKGYGLHAFLVPIRDENHNLFPNVEAGDIGPKYGYQTKDNGYVIFKKHRIPRDHMLMRYAKVSRNGEYKRRGDERISFATMLITRAIIPISCVRGLAKGCTILTRYSLIRTQFKDDSGREVPILDYQLQQQKIFPKIAESYALQFATKKLSELSRMVLSDAKQRQKFDRLNEVHSLTSGLKAIFTTDCLRGLEILRRAAGGHGFSLYSGLPGMLSELGPTPTFQGQNSVLHLQVARYLMKMLGFIQKGKPLHQTSIYLSQINDARSFVADYDSIEPLMVIENMRKIFLYNSCQQLNKAAQKMMGFVGEGAKEKQVWDYKLGLSLVECSKAHIYFWLIDNFIQEIYSGSKSQKNRAVLIKVFLLYCVDKILEMGSNFFEAGVISASTLKNCQVLKEKLLKELRPEALGLVQSFGFHDEVLHSAIGQYDGRAYQRMLEWAMKQNRVNKPQVLADIYQEWSKAKKNLQPKL